MRTRKSLEGLAVCLAFAGLSACAGPGSRDEIAARAEEVFRRHNQAETKLLSVLPRLAGEQPEAYEALLVAEESMLDACEKLNELAIAHRDNKRVGLKAKSQVPKTIDACEQHTQIVEELLEGV